jgi:hypothetical protein
MLPGDEYPQDLYFIMLYNKTAQVLVALRGIMGEERFHRAFRAYGRAWVGRHPQPYDFFNAMSAAAGRDLSWFWRTWFYETWPLDQAIENVAVDGDSVAIKIGDRGVAPMPVLLEITRADGSVQRETVPVDVWLTGARETVFRIPVGAGVTRVRIDPDGVFPDIDTSNQEWRRGDRPYGP